MGESPQPEDAEGSDGPLSGVIWMDYDANTPTGMSARRGERFSVVTRDVSGWTRVKIVESQKEGGLPDVYTRPTCASAYQHHELVYISNDFKVDASDKWSDVLLSLVRGDQVHVVTTENGWAYGYVRAQCQRRGWFPQQHLVGCAC